MSNRWRACGASSTLFVLLALPGCERDWDITVPDVSSSYPLPSDGCEGGAGDVDAGSAGLVASDVYASPILALADGTLFWVDTGASANDSIQSVAAAGGEPSPVYQSSSDGTNTITDLVTDGTNLYFIETALGTSSVQSLPVDGGAPTLLATIQGYDTALALAGGDLYISDGQTVLRVSTKGGDVATAGQGGTGLVTDDGAAYWFDGQDLVTRDAPDAKSMSLVKNVSRATILGDDVASLAANDRDLFWVCQDNSSMLLCATSERGGGVERIVTALPGYFPPTALAADSSNVYFMQGASVAVGCDNPGWTLQETGVKGGSPVTIAAGLSLATSTSMEHALAVDDSYVYWVGLGALYRAPK